MMNSKYALCVPRAYFEFLALYRGTENCKRVHKAYSGSPLNHVQHHECRVLQTTPKTLYLSSDNHSRIEKGQFLMQPLIKNLESLLNLFLKFNCPLCQRPTSQEFCQNCTRQLQKCHLRNPNFKQKSMPVFAWGTYGGMLKSAITAMKYAKQPQIARPLGRWLGEAWLLHSPVYNKVVVVPIPLHPNKQKDRGYNQAALIAQSFCETTGLKLKHNGLARVRSTEAQYSLSASKRSKNLAEAFEIGKDFRRHQEVSVLLVDDIYTTGATAMSAMQTLNQAGIKVVGLAATAVTLKG